MNYNIIELCAGSGGMSSGFINAGFVPLLLNDKDKTCCNTLQKNYPKIQVICEDMSKMDLSPYKNRTDVLVGGLPCQSFSTAGKRGGLESSPGNLVYDFIRLVKEVNPRVFLLENVKGLLSLQKGQILKIFIELLKVNGKYNVYHKLLNAVHYGVPQKRERVFFVGISNDIPELYEFPLPLSTTILLREVLLGCPPSPGYEYPQWKREIMDQIPEGGCWIHLPQEIQKSYLGRSYGAGGGQRGVARRLSMDEPCLTLTTSPCQKRTEKCHPLETRPLNVREYARIQTYPDDYFFSGSVASQYRQIGNSVPVSLAYHVALSIKKLLNANACVS